MHYKKEGKNYMKQSGITRRIDELGRIVIPKEIRKNMHIKTGELLEIYLEKENKIILKKHDIISLKDEFLRSFINNLSLEIKSNVYLTNLNNIIFSNDEKQVGKTISNWLENEMSLNTNINNTKEFKLTEDKTIDSNYKVHYLLPNGDLLGLLIIEYKSDSNSNTENIIDFSKKIIEDYFESN